MAFFCLCYTFHFLVYFSLCFLSFLFAHKTKSGTLVFCKTSYLPMIYNMISEKLYIIRVVVLLVLGGTTLGLLFVIVVVVLLVL